MSIMKDPYDFIRWNPNRDYKAYPALDGGEWGLGRQWLRQISNLMTNCTPMAVIVALFRLLLN
jgi:hypothetical protein